MMFIFELVHSFGKNDKVTVLNFKSLVAGFWLLF